MTSEKDLHKKLKALNLAEKEIFDQVNMKIIASFEPIQRLLVRTASFIVLILSFQSSSLHLSTAQAGVILPRMGAVIELDQVTPADPWEDRSSRVQWVLARLNCEGFRVWLLDPQKPITHCQVIYFDGPTFKKAFSSLKDDRIGILQSASRKLLENLPPGEILQASPRVFLEYHRTGTHRVVTVRPDLAACFNDYRAVEGLGRAILWLAGLPEDSPRIAPFPDGKRSAAVFIVHGEGYSEKMDLFQKTFLDGPGALTYAVSEGAIENYGPVVKTFVRSSRHEVAIHNHHFEKGGSEEGVLSANLELHEKALEAQRPFGLIGPYLLYFNDLREALMKYHRASGARDILPVVSRFSPVTLSTMGAKMTQAPRVALTKFCQGCRLFPVIELQTTLFKIQGFMSKLIKSGKHFSFLRQVNQEF